jgi:AraC-like DNA-binding protein
MRTSYDLLTRSAQVLFVQTALSLLEEKSSLRGPGRGVSPLADAYYRQPGTQSGRMILGNDCLILQNVQMGKAETRKEVAMTVMIDQQGKREAIVLQAYREELVERIGRAISFDGSVQPLQGLHLYRHSVPLERVYSVVDPSVCVVAQGCKEFLLGESHYRYDPFHYLLSTVDLPNIGQVLEASKERPFLSLRLSLDPSIVSSVMLEAAYAPSRKPTGVRAIDVSLLDANLLEATVRLTRLLDSPTEAPILLPLIMREIVYRLLMGEQGVRLRHLATLGGGSSPIARAVERLRQDFDRPLRVEQLARELGMSVSGFHQHFKAVTALSPLQFQKRLRLQEARRLMLSEDLDAASAAYRVGYQDASHFNREYKSLFGVPPMRDMQQLREAALSQTSR